MSGFLEWVTHGVKRGRLEIGRRTALYLFVLVVVLALMATLYLMLVSRTAARGRRIEQLRSELLRLGRENAQLEVEIAQEGAVDLVRQRALDLGFTPARDVVFLFPPDEEQ